CQANGFTEVIRSQSEKFGYVPVKVVYNCEDGCKPAREERFHDDESAEKRSYFEEYDLEKIKEIQRTGIPHWYPDGFDMTWMSRYQRDAVQYYGVKSVADMFTKRNLWALAAIRHAITKIEDPAIRDALMFGLTGMMLNTTRMCKDRGK